MRSILGIDAAWTNTQPSGVALAVESPSGWQLLAAESSYSRFFALAKEGAEREVRPSGSKPSASALLETCYLLCGSFPDVVAIDMPLSNEPITERRSSDNAVSRAYGGRKCSTHTPSATRPGPISDALREEFHGRGYPLQTTSPAAPGLYEVYPHPALVELAGAAERLPYKASKARKYWPTVSPSERRSNLFAEWRKIAAVLEEELSGTEGLLPEIPLASSGIEIKAYEDALDAAICAWIGILILEGKAIPFGDEVSAIWIPRPRLS